MSCRAISVLQPPAESDLVHIEFGGAVLRGIGGIRGVAQYGRGFRGYLAPVVGVSGGISRKAIRLEITLLEAGIRH